MSERWDCIFVDRIELDGRIYLTQPQEHGFMYVSFGGEPSSSMKIRKSIPECEPIKGSSNENKMLRAIAISTALDRLPLQSSRGLVVRGFDALNKPLSIQIVKQKDHEVSPRIGGTPRVKGTTGWIAYISPKERFYLIVNDRYQGAELPEDKTKLIHRSIEYIQRKWRIGGPSHMGSDA